MIVHRTLYENDRANESRAFRRSEREFKDSHNFNDSSIYRVVIIRMLDEYRIILKTKFRDKKNLMNSSLKKLNEQFLWKKSYITQIDTWVI
jgi:hypothetical protein